MEKLSEMAREELKTRVSGMTSEEMQVTLEVIPVEVIAAHLCCRVNLMNHKLNRLRDMFGGV